jgi:hypothetical protein
MGPDFGIFDNLSRDRWHALVEANRKLIAIFEEKSKANLDENWGNSQAQRIRKNDAQDVNSGDSRHHGVG